MQILFQTNADTRRSSIFSKAPQLISVTYKNNGRPFSSEDFARLRKIAEGNPDEQKVRVVEMICGVRTLTWCYRLVSSGWGSIRYSRYVKNRSLHLGIRAWRSYGRV